MEAIMGAMAPGLVPPVASRPFSFHECRGRTTFSSVTKRNQPPLSRGQQLLAWSELVAAGANGKFSQKFIPKVAAAEIADDAETLDGVDSGGFYGAGSKVADSESLDGLDSEQFLKDRAGALGTSQGYATPTTILEVPNHGELQGTCGNPSQPTVSWKNTSGSTQRLFVDDGGANATHIHPVAVDASAGTVVGSTSTAVGDHITYLVREPGFVWIDVFTTVPSGGGCFF
jgi:hypothetical protein